MSTKVQAIKAGRTLLKKMKGSGWQVRVWENIGWYYKVHSGPVSVYPTSAYGDTRYFCLISDDIERADSGLALWTNSKALSRKDPNVAVREAVTVVTKVINQHLEVKRAALRAVDK